MKITNVSPALFKNLNFMQNTQPATTVTSPVESKPSKDIVSFSGYDENESICNNFGLLTEDCLDVSKHFDTKTKENKDSEQVLDTLLWNVKDKKVGFFGDEMDFATALEKNEFKPKNFNAKSNAKFSIISYDNEGIHYNLKYDKNTHALVNASAEIIKDNAKDAIERIAVKQSKNNEGDYIAHYQFIDDKNGERAVEETYILFDKNMNVKASHTAKSFQYSDGEKEEQKFARVYEDGIPQTADIKDTVPYIW